MSVTIFGLGAYFYLDELDKDDGGTRTSSLGWLPLVSKLCNVKPSSNSNGLKIYLN